MNGTLDNKPEMCTNVIIPTVLVKSKLTYTFLISTNTHGKML